MTAAEDFKAGRESRVSVVHRAARSAGYTDLVQRLVAAAVYRETHHAEPETSIQDNPAGKTGA